MFFQPFLEMSHSTINHTTLSLIFRINSIKIFAEEEHFVQWVLMIMII